MGKLRKRALIACEVSILNAIGSNRTSALNPISTESYKQVQLTCVINNQQSLRFRQESLITQTQWKDVRLHAKTKNAVE